MSFLSGLASLYREGGLFMNFILATAVFVVAIAVERLIVLLPAASLNTRKLVQDLVSFVNAGDVNSARNLSRLSNAPAARVAFAMIQASGGGDDKVQAAADDAATLALAPLQRRLQHLGLLANCSTLLGLLGTISGLITAFSGVGAADPSQRSAFLAAGISTALNTTSFGLMVAVPTLLVQGYLAGMLDGIHEQVDEVTIRLGQVLSRQTAALGGAQVVALPGQSARMAGNAPRVAAGGGQ
jgi:biopolymer transport protein ExbB/TolQ